MQLPPFRFTLGQLLTMIAGLAVFLTVIRMPLGSLFVVIGLVYAGFAIDRVRGGSGFRGGVLAGTLSRLALGVYQLASHQFLFEDPSALTFGSTLLGLIFCILIGGVWGVVVSTPAWIVVSVNQSWSGEGPGDDVSDDRTVRSSGECHNLVHTGTEGPPS